MSASAIALVIIFAIVLAASALGFYAGARRRMDLEQWTVAGRGFGLVFMWLLMAGEIYTAFTFLGASGWAYEHGGPTLYILAYGTLGYVVSFFILPPVWELGRKYGLQTQPDFFGTRYGSKYLAGFVALVGVAFIIPYLQLQLTGLGIIMQVASFDGIGRAPAMIVAVALLTAFVFTGGLRAVAWVSIVKDGLMLCAAFFIGIEVPRIHFGGIGPMFAALARSRPAHLTMPGATTDQGHAWYISTVLLTALGFYMWPHSFASAFSAKSAATLRRNAVFMPVYQITMALMLFVGFSAVLVAPGLRDSNLALLIVVRKTFSPWFLGVIGGAGALTAMVPAAIIVLTAATSFAKNLYRPLFAPSMTDDAVARLARIAVVALSLISLYLAIYTSTTLVALLLFAYAGATQFFPGVVLGLFWKRVTAAGVFAGIVTGVGATIVLVLSKRDPFFGFNAGFVALCLNFLITVILSLLANGRTWGRRPRLRPTPA
jgi:SSS family solute:Na+ symporter